jgi:glycerol-3-phosphate O-acyltransferase/dihydroxyacetone phosphate acyltransferase
VDEKDLHGCGRYRKPRGLCPWGIVGVVRDALCSVLVAFLRLVTRVFFRSVEVSGLENVPASGPVIFVGNHPNSLLDPVLVTTTCGRHVRFAAKETLFAQPLLKPFLWLLGSVPIRRRQDQVQGAKEDAPVEGAPERVDNSAAFDALFHILEQGEAFGIFPEGISHTRPELAPLKTGAARIALGVAQKQIPVWIVLVGLSYCRCDRMCSRVLVQYGQPLVVDDELVRAYADDPLRAAKEMTARIGLALRAQTINASDFDTLRVLDGVRKLYQPQKVTLTLAQQAELMRRFIEHWQRHQGEPEVRAFYQDVDAYLLQLRALGLMDRDLRGDPPLLVRLERLVKHLLFVLVLVPAAVPGFLIHLPVLLTAVWAGETLTERGDVKATIKMCAATLLTLAIYVVIGAAVVWRDPTPAGVSSALATIGGLLLSGYATIRVLEKQSELRRSVDTFIALLHLDDEIARLAAERERLRAALLDLIDRYLAPEVPRIVERSAHDDVKAWLDAEDMD